MSTPLILIRIPRHSNVPLFNQTLIERLWVLMTPMSNSMARLWNPADSLALFFKDICLFLLRNKSNSNDFTVSIIQNPD